MPPSAWWKELEADQGRRSRPLITSRYARTVYEHN